MKFLVVKELRHNPLLKSVVLLLVAFLGLFLVSDMILHHLQIGLSPSKATETLLGNEESFIEPILFDALLERIHVDIFTSMMTLVLLSIIYMRVLDKEKSKVIHLAFITAILSPIAIILAYFYGTVFIVSWIGLFILWHLSGLYLSMGIVWSLLKR